jgi:hypothetical protein
MEFDMDYVPHFLAHYSKLGIRKATFIMHQNTADNKLYEKCSKTVQIYSRLYDIDLTEVRWVGEFNSPEKTRRINYEVNIHSWNLVVDLDEFLEPKIPLSTLEHIPKGAIYAIWEDRVAEKGMPALKPIEKESIYTQYPVKAQIAKTMKIHPIWKTVLFRGFKMQDAHWVLDCNDPRTFTPQTKMMLGNVCRTADMWKLMHFKWVASTKRKLQYREVSFKEQGLPWWVISTTALKIFKERESDADVTL